MTDISSVQSPWEICQDLNFSVGQTTHGWWTGYHERLVSHSRTLVEYASVVDIIFSLMKIKTLLFQAKYCIIDKIIVVTSAQER